MDWSTFILGAVAGIYFWNRLNPKVRELICSLFSQGGEVLFSAAEAVTQSVVEEPATQSKPEKSTIPIEYQTALTRAFDNGKHCKRPDLPEGMYKEGSPLSQYIYNYLFGFISYALLRIGPPVPSVPNTKQQA